MEETLALSITIVIEAVLLARWLLSPPQDAVALHPPGAFASVRSAHPLGVSDTSLMPAPVAFAVSAVTADPLYVNGPAPLLLVILAVLGALSMWSWVVPLVLL